MLIILDENLNVFRNHVGQFIDTSFIDIEDSIEGPTPVENDGEVSTVMKVIQKVKVKTVNSGCVDCGHCRILSTQRGFTYRHVNIEAHLHANIKYSLQRYRLTYMQGYR